MATPLHNAASPPELSGETLDYLNLQPGETVLHFGKSSREFVQQIIHRIGRQGTVFVLPSVVANASVFNAETGVNQVSQVTILNEKTGHQIPLKNGTVDWVFMINILHWFYNRGELTPVFKEIRRVHKPDGKLIVVECEPIPDTPGPPLEMRIPSFQMNSIVYPNGYFLYHAWPINNYMFMGYYKRQPLYEPQEDETLGN